MGGTTIEEVKKYHRDTLVICVDDANEEYKKIEERKLELEQIEKNQFKKAINRKIKILSSEIPGYCKIKG